VADYLPDERGHWLVAVRGGVLLVLPADRTGELADLWPGLGPTDAAARVIDRLASGGVASTPSFALVVREPADGTVRAVVRGPLTVRLGEVEVSGAEVSTWQERVVGGTPAVRVSADEAGERPIGAGVRANRLPIVEGVVAASVVDWPSEEPARVVEATAAAPAAPAPSTAPVGDDAEPASDRPEERTMVPEDTVVGFSRTERPRIPTGAGDDRAAALDAAVATTLIEPPPGIANDASAAPPGAAPPAELGDHDGLTVASSDLRRLREERDREPGVERRPAAYVAAPGLALRLPDGSIEPIVGELLLGRAPAIGRVTGGRMPRAVVIGAGDPDISRTHLRVAVEGGTAVVTDLDSRNGTHVVAPGLPPVRLRPSEATPVLPDTVIDLGGGWTIQVVVR
jgi:hypothetical protein